MTTETIPFEERRTRHTTRSWAHSERPRLLPLAVFVLGVVALFFAMIYLRIALDQTAFELDTIQRQTAAEHSHQLDLRFELAGLQNPLRISTEAERIGLVHPEERIAVVVNLLATDTQIMVTEVPVRALPGDTP